MEGNGKKKRKVLWIRKVELYVGHSLVISLLWGVVELLKGLLHDLKLIVKAEIILGCTLEVLAEIVGALLNDTSYVLSFLGFL